MHATLMAATRPCLQLKRNNRMSYVLAHFPILERLEAAGRPLEKGTQSWMAKWKDLDLEAPDRFTFPELGGSTSITMKVDLAATGKSCGSFQPRNSAGNPYTEIAYFNLASILGWGQLVRPAARYELGPKASASFRNLIEANPIKGQQRRQNKANILAAIASGGPLRGAMKAKKPDTAKSLDAIANRAAAHNGAPNTTHPIIVSVQASSPQPLAGKSLGLTTGYSGDALELAREYSILMTLDAIFEQWDRYSGGNVGIRHDNAGQAHFYATDNGGAGPSKSATWADRNLSWFSRYDQTVVNELARLADFLNVGGSAYLGYAKPREFIEDLGLYFDLSADEYVVRMARNISKLLSRVNAQQAKYGSGAFLR